MFASALSVLLVTLAAVRFPGVPLLALLPATLGAALAAGAPAGRGTWAAGVLAAVWLLRMPGGGYLALVVLLAPVLVTLVRQQGTLHPAVVAIFAVPLSAYLSGVAGSGSTTVPLLNFLDLCAAVALGATLSAIAYAPTERERLGPGGRAGLRVR